MFGVERELERKCCLAITTMSTRSRKEVVLAFIHDLTLTRCLGTYQWKADPHDRFWYSVNHKEN